LGIGPNPQSPIPNPQVFVYLNYNFISIYQLNFNLLIFTNLLLNNINMTIIRYYQLTNELDLHYPKIVK